MVQRALTVASLLLIWLISAPLVQASSYDQGAMAYNHHQYGLAWRHFEVAAAAGSSKAMLMLGLMSDNGLGMQRDSRKAYHWYLQAANAGEPQAMYNLYEMLARGDGVAANMQQALRWLQQSAEYGFAEGQYRWAEQLHQGKHIARDDQTALMWLEIVAEVNVGGVELAIALRDQLRQQLGSQDREQARQRAHLWKLQNKAMDAPVI